MGAGDRFRNRGQGRIDLLFEPEAAFNNIDDMRPAVPVAQQPGTGKEWSPLTPGLCCCLATRRAGSAIVHDRLLVRDCPLPFSRDSFLLAPVERICLDAARSSGV